VGLLHKQLRHQGKKYNKHGEGSSARAFIRNRINITQKPPILEEKTRPGDWELDTIIRAKPQKGVIVPVVERTSKLTMAKNLPFIKRLALIYLLTSTFEHHIHSWQRDLNEHTNGLVGQYFLKSQG
jgi:IS30 family transposase